MYNLIIGLDISKTTLDATIVKWKDQCHWHDSFLNKLFGFKQLLHWVDTHSSEDNKLLFCMEHTGYYAHHLIAYLTRHQLDYTLINPLKIKRSMGLRREKSDKADSKVIANYGLKFQEDLIIGNALEQEFLDLQLLLAHRKRLQEKQLSFQRHQKHLSHCLSTKMAKIILRDIKKHKRYFNKPLHEVEHRIDELIFNHPLLKRHFELLTSIPGIGRVIALYTILFTRNFTQITCPRKFACYCGVVPFKNESGTSVRKGARISFYANRNMKGMLNFGAMNAVKYDPQLKEYYHKQVEKKNNKMTVLNAVRNKLIHRMYAVVKRGTPYVVHQHI